MPANLGTTPLVVLVTGASSGLGYHFCEALLRSGCVVYAAARRVEKMKPLEAKGAHTLKMDITQEADLKQVVATILAAHGRLDVLVNNAGFGLFGSVEDVPLAEAQRQFDVNLFGLARLTQLVLPHMRQQGSGRVINISSMAGKVYGPLGAWYYATKHALEGWSDCLRVEVAPFNIDVVILEPGVIRTEFAEQAFVPLLTYSGDKSSSNGAYTALAQRLHKAYTKVYQQKTRSSEPKVITRLLLKAVFAKNPHPRYMAGRFAKLAVWARRWLGDRIYDAILRHTI